MLDTFVPLGFYLTRFLSDTQSLVSEDLLGTTRGYVW